MSVFPTSASKRISLWCPQKVVYILSASPNLEVLMAQVLELFGVVVYYPYENECGAKSSQCFFLDKPWPAVDYPRQCWT